MENLIAILPTPTAASAPFWEACDSGELHLPHCRHCNRSFYYPRRYCPACGSSQLDMRRASGRGRIFSFTHVNVSFYGAQWESQIPYTVVLIDLDEGVRLLSRLIGPDRDAVAIGDTVAVEFVEIEGHRLPFFRREAKG